jgi:hypothetical protein
MSPLLIAILRLQKAVNALDIISTKPETSRKATIDKQVVGTSSKLNFWSNVLHFIINPNEWTPRSFVNAITSSFALS